MLVEVYEASDTSTVIASDSVTIFAVEEGGDAITIIMPNDNHTLPRTAAGVATLTGSGTEVRVRKGATLLTATNNTPTAGQFKVTRSASTGITLPTGAPTLSDSDSNGNNDTATFADISSVTSDFVRGEIEYSIEVGYTGTNVTFAKSQSITVAKSGSDGATVNFAFVRLPAGTSDSDVTAATNGTATTPADFTISGTTYTWSDSVPSGTDTLFAVEGTKAGTATQFTWGTPYRLEGTMAKELIIYSDVTTGDAPNDPVASYNFTTGVLTLSGLNASFWNLTPPSFGATPADGAKIFAVTCVVTGSINDTAKAVLGSDWSAPFIHAIHEKGDQGDPGVRGVKIKELILYYVHTFSNANFTTLSTPSTGTYNFNSDTLASIPSGWTRTKPAAAAGSLIMSSEALATENTSLNNVSGSLTWSTPGLADSAFGDVEFIFKRSATQPTTPSSSTWPVTNSSIPSGWYNNVSDVPSGANPIWSSQGAANMVGTSLPFSFTFTWQTPVLIEGSDGEDATNTAVVTLYKRSTSGSTAPAVPDNNITYTFATGGISGSLDGWSTSVPSGTAQYVWSCNALAIGAGAATTDTIVPSDWSTPTVLTEAQQPRRDTKNVYYDAWTVGSTKPTIDVSSVTYNFTNKTLGSLPSGWSATVPTDAEFAWVTLTIQESTFGGTKTITAGEVNTVFIPGDFSKINPGDFDVRIEDTDFQFSLDGGTAYTTASAIPNSIKNNQISIGADGALANAGGGQVTVSGIGAETPSGAQTKVNNRLSATEKTRLNSGKTPDDSLDLNNANVDKAHVGLSNVTNHAQVKSDGSNAPNILLNSQVSINADGTLSNAGSGQVTTSGIGAETPTGAQTKVNNRLSSTEKTRLNSGKSPDNTKNFDNAGTFTGNITGTIDGTAAGTVKSGAAAGATANQDSTATILGGNLTGSVGGTAVATIKSGAAAGATANQDSTATILGGDHTGSVSGNVTGKVNNVAVSTISGGAARANAGLDSSGNVQRVVPKLYGGFGERVDNVSGIPTLSSGSFSFNSTLPTSFGGTGINNFSVDEFRNDEITIDADGILQGIGTSAKIVDNSITGNSRTLSITSASAAYKTPTPSAGGSSVNTSAYNIFVGTDSQPTYGGLTYISPGQEIRPKPFFVGAMQSGGFSAIRGTNFQINMQGQRRFYSVVGKTVSTTGFLYVWIGAGISSSATTYSEVTNGFIGWNQIYSNTSLQGNTSNTTNNLELGDWEIIVPDAAKSIGTGHLWMWVEYYLGSVAENDANLAIGITDRTDSEIVLDRTTGASQTGSYAHSTLTATINT